MNNALKNAKVVRRFLEYQRDAKKRSEATVRMYERSMRIYELATCDSDFAKFGRAKVKQLESYLEKREMSSRQVYQIYNQLRSFFRWLAYQPGYKSRIDVSDIEYLSLDRKMMQEVTSPGVVDWPSKVHVVRLVSSISPDSEIDMRDQALISFLFLSGMRDMAVASLPLECFDSHTLEVKQYPDRGVATKFSKRFVSKLFDFDQALLKTVLEWKRYLINERQFSARDPLFPKSRVLRSDATAEFEASEVEPVFWKSAGPIRKIINSRSNAAGLRYYPPHAFRHAASQLALRQCTTPEEIRAVSQNLGHEHVATTLISYGKLDGNRVSQVLDLIDFQSESHDKLDPRFEKQFRLLMKKQQIELD